MNDKVKEKVWVRKLIPPPPEISHYIGMGGGDKLSSPAVLGLESHVECEDPMLRLRNNLILNLNMKPSNST